MFLGLLLGFVFGIMAFVFLCMRTRSISMRFKNGICIGFTMRLMMSIYEQQLRYESQQKAYRDKQRLIKRMQNNSTSITSMGNST